MVKFFGILCLHKSLKFKIFMWTEARVCSHRVTSAIGTDTYVYTYVHMHAKFALLINNSIKVCTDSNATYNIKHSF